jgi:hypothetical protein
MMFWALANNGAQTTVTRQRSCSRANERWSPWNIISSFSLAPALHCHVFFLFIGQCAGAKRKRHSV